MIRSGGIDVVVTGLREDTLRFSWPADRARASQAGCTINMSGPGLHSGNNPAGRMECPLNRFVFSLLARRLG